MRFCFDSLISSFLCFPAHGDGNQVLNKPTLLFDGVVNWGTLCLGCPTGVRIKKPTGFALDYRKREDYLDHPDVSINLEQRCVHPRA